MASYHWSIATDQEGSGSFEFTVNPIDISQAFPPEAYSTISTLRGSPIPQYPETDTRLRTMKFDLVPDKSTAHRDFLLGDTETDAGTILNLGTRDSNGALTIYWLTVPTPYKHLRPRGYRDAGSIPIRVYDVRTIPESPQGIVRWRVEVDFRIVPSGEADYVFQLDESPMDQEHHLIDAALGAVFTYDLSTGVYDNETATAYTGGNPFPNYNIVPGDKLYLGALTRFWGIYIEVDTVETIAPDEEQGATAHEWEYWNGTGWVALTVDDQLDSFTRTAKAVQYASASGWAENDLGNICIGAPPTDQFYWIRVEFGTVTTPFDFDKILRC